MTDKQTKPKFSNICLLKEPAQNQRKGSFNSITRGLTFNVKMNIVREFNINIILRFCII